MSHTHTLSCLEEVNGQLSCKETRTDPSHVRERGTGISPARSTTTRRGGLDFEWDIFSSKLPSHKPGSAATDRGWVRLTDVRKHPDYGRVSESYLSEHLTVGNYVTYDSTLKSSEKPVIASAYVKSVDPTSKTHGQHETKRFKNVSQAREWIEKTVARMLIQMGKPMPKSKHPADVWTSYRTKHAVERMPDRGFALSDRHLGTYETYFLDKAHATRGAQLLANSRKRSIELVQIQNRGNDRFIVGEFEPKR